MYLYVHVLMSVHVYVVFVCIYVGRKAFVMGNKHKLGFSP